VGFERSGNCGGWLWSDSLAIDFSEGSTPPPLSISICLILITQLEGSKLGSIVWVLADIDKRRALPPFSSACVEALLWGCAPCFRGVSSTFLKLSGTSLNELSCETFVHDVNLPRERKVACVGGTYHTFG